MNGKASVSKELDSRHSKILEGLLKLPGNRECADCKSRAPRWASVNLGIFICMHCSGIHRSLGVHISQVRSTTLDTWLPDQVSSMQAMGNEKSNGYWEAELPPGYDRSSVETFIRAKYGEKRWISKEGCVSNDIPIISSYSQKRQQAYKSVKPLTTSDLSAVTEHTQPPWNSQAERKQSNSILLDVRVTDVPKEKTHRPSSKGNWASFDSVTRFKDTPDGMGLMKDSNRRRATSADGNSDWAIFDCKNLTLYPLPTINKVLCGMIANCGSFCLQEKLFFFFFNCELLK